MTMWVGPLTSAEIDIIEDVLGPGKLYLLNKAWEERRNLLRTKRSYRGTIKFLREEGRKELDYYENKLEEITKVEEHMNETIRDLIFSLEKKIEPEFYERILKLSDPWNKIGEKPEEEDLLY